MMAIQSKIFLDKTTVILQCSPETLMKLNTTGQTQCTFQARNYGVRFALLKMEKWWTHQHSLFNFSGRKESSVRSFALLPVRCFFEDLFINNSSVSVACTKLRRWLHWYIPPTSKHMLSVPFYNVTAQTRQAGHKIEERRTTNRVV